MKKSLNKNCSGFGSLCPEFLFKFFLYLLPVVLFFSYYPIISLGANESMNFELSLPLIWLVVFDVFSFGFLVKEKKLKNILKYWQWLLFPAFLTISVFWSPNFLRGILTIGILWLIYFAVFSIFSLRKLIDVVFRKKFFKVFFVSAIIVSAWCFVQCVLDLAGAGREYSLMCAGCTYRSFGFPHPNGFAIEPQFMGNLLLAPAIVSAWFYVAKKQNGKKLKLERSRGDNFLPFCFFVFTATLFLTFSRGAIYAFVVAMIFVTSLCCTKYLTRDRKLERAPLKVLWDAGTKRRVSRGKLFRVVGSLWGIIILAFLFTLNLQGIMAQVSRTNDTYFSGISKVLNHLSLGIIDLRGGNNIVSIDPSEDISEKDQALESEVYLVENIVENSEKIGENASFDGYVAESTDVRVGLSKAAIRAWLKDLKTILFGVGVGGAGETLYRDGLSSSPKEITQNQYTSLLLEAGAVGILLLVLTLALILRVVTKDPSATPILTLLVAYGISLLFFSGLPNALHIYLLPPVLMVLLDQNNSLRKKLVS